ncbi:LuxR family transcriptional regulator [Sphingosinicella sp. CPCC 101087]|uniref:helix-turn-helix transcriptional regulator n=1 Tax=Sphingosinicella sp. CPCC 101087 TaxID=2497754 RepID=UPI00197CF020|nr:LuxR family transcriptional regulator [Sphingosinicella sp. CPCC 101087]
MLSQCGSDAELAALLDDVARELGFSYFALLHHSSLSRRRTGLIRIDTYPDGWEEELSARRLIGADPVHLASQRTNTGFVWSELGELVPLGPAQRDVLERSVRFGIGAGFTVPVNVPGEPGGSCSFAVRPGADLPWARLRCAETIGAHGFRAARRIHGYPACSRPPRLSRRQLECLRLVAAGKTDWEISRILGLGVETARQYVKSARRAYDAATRTQLAVHGLRDALISFDEAIPPSG